MNEKDNQKVKDIVSFIMEECEKRDLSMEEARLLPIRLSSEMTERLASMKKTIKFSIKDS